MAKDVFDRFAGCMYGIALGDALGWPVEFSSWESIQKRYGANGIRGFETIRAPYEYTDDTQMSIYTAYALLEDGDFVENVARQYIAWYALQSTPGGSRAPGGTCMSAIRSYMTHGRYGTLADPINDSKGCGGVMRTAPIGLVHDAKTAFKMGAEAAAVTHGHVSGYLSAGFMSALISEIVAGKDLATSYTTAKAILMTYKGYHETLIAVERAYRRAVKANEYKLDVEATVLDIETLFGDSRPRGGGWIGEEALAIALYCAIRCPDNFAEAIIMGANHSGDADSTASMAGAIVGALVGASNIREDWKENVEDSDLLLDLANLLYAKYEERTARVLASTIPASP